MKFSMNGFRRNLNRDMHCLRDLVKDAINGEDIDYEDLADAVNEVISNVNALNCIYTDNDPDFTDMSDKCVEHLEYDGEHAS